ncbi:hypothetical protein GCM10025857_68490 [Alicyclobacillus contaminans]|nr:hypothetical protein GCM10025857_68490 [Alicyclobacillus contaminans]
MGSVPAVDWLEDWCVLKGVSGIFGKYIGDAMGKMGSAVQSDGKPSLNTFWTRILLRRFVKKAFDVVTKIPADMIKAGKDIVNGLWQGIANMGATLKANISSFIDEHIPKVVRDVLASTLRPVSWLRSVPTWGRVCSKAYSSQAPRCSRPASRWRTR